MTAKDGNFKIGNSRIEIGKENIVQVIDFGVEIAKQSQWIEMAQETDYFIGELIIEVDEQAYDEHKSDAC